MKQRGKKTIGKKGKLFWDEGANKKLIKPTQEAGFKVEDLPVEYRNIGLSDPQVASRFAKGMPVVTDDYTAYKEGSVEKGATAYIQHDTVSAKSWQEYILRWQTFLKDHTSRTLRGYCWIVPAKGKVTKKPMGKK